MWKLLFKNEVNSRILHQNLKHSTEGCTFLEKLLKLNSDVNLKQNTGILQFLWIESLENVSKFPMQVLFLLGYRNRRINSLIKNCTKHAYVKEEGFRSLSYQKMFSIVQYGLIGFWTRILDSYKPHCFKSLH